MRAKVEPQQSDYYDHGAFAHGQNLPIKIKEERNKKYVTNKMCSSSPGFEPGPPEELDLYLPKSLIFRSLHSVLRSHAKGHRFEPGRRQIVLIAFDFFSGTVSRLQLILRALDNLYATIFNLNSLNTVPEIKILKNKCFFTNETGEKWLQTPKSSPPLKRLLDFRKGWELFLPS